MKIYGDYTFLLDKLHIRNNSELRVFQNGAKVVEFADQFIEEQKAASKDKVSISREGMGYLRDRMEKAEFSDGVSFPEEGELIVGDGLSLMDGLCRTYILGKLDNIDDDGVSSNLYGEMMKRYKAEMSSKDAGELAGHGESLALAHLAMKEKIEEGYANGTREVWVVDESTGDDFSGVELEINGHAVRYRRLTMEEELDGMEKAFGRLKEDVAVHVAKERLKDTAAAEEEANKDDAEGSAEEEFWKLKDMAEGLLKELDALISEIEAMFKKKEEPEDFGARLMEEMNDHGAEIVADGQRQMQCANYRKMSDMSKMAMDVQSILGSLRA